jgi:hypothetical protein
MNISIEGTFNLNQFEEIKSLIDEFNTEDEQEYIRNNDGRYQNRYIGNTVNCSFDVTEDDILIIVEEKPNF